LSADGRSGRTTRRGALYAAAALASHALVSRASWGRARVPLGGRISLRAPWPVGSVDPHRQDDAAALFFGACLFESLYAIDAAGSPIAALAEAMPEPSPAGTRVTLREGVRFASGRPVTARDVAASLARADRLAGRAWTEPLGAVRVVGRSELVFAARAHERVARTLASPLVAVVPEGFVPERPDGTGPFAAEVRAGSLLLSRNPFAAGGPSFLDGVSIAAAADLAASLRAFESGEDDVGWLGLGLHEPRRGAVPFDAGALGWAILRIGDQAGRWNLPGVAQRLADGIDPSRLAHLGIASERAVEPDDGWGGPPSALLVRDDSPWLVELARAVAAALSRPDHEVRAQPLPAPDFARARASHAYTLALDLVRPFDRTPLGTYVTLATADDPARGAELARHPPLGSADPRVIGRVLRVGVVADVRFAGGRMAELTLPRGPGGVGVDFGAIIHPGPRVP